MYTVYKIEIDGVVKYVGHSKDLKKRQYQHNYSYRKGKKKELYDYIREVKTEDYKIELIPIHEFKSKPDAKRFEMYLILHYKFIRDNSLEVPLWDSVDLLQTIPSLRDM